MALDGKPPLPLNQQRWSQLMRKLGVVKGDNVVSELHQQVFPVVVLEDDRPEHKFAAGERLAWGQYLLAAAGAGITGYIGLRNPLTSGIVLVVEWFQGHRYSGSNLMYLALARGATLTQQNTEQPRDTRWQASGAFGVGAPNITGQIVSGRSDTIVVTPFVVAELGPVGSVAQVCEANDLAICLAPGDTLITMLSDAAGGTVVNAALQASFRWRERTLEPGET